MKHYQKYIEESYLGGEILRSSSKCKKWTYHVIFAGAEKFGHCWKVNFIFSCLYRESPQEDYIQGASSSNMIVVVEPEQSIRFENYLGLTKKETVESKNGCPVLCDRFYPVKYIKFIEIETDRIEYEICFV